MIIVVSCLKEENVYIIGLSIYDKNNELSWYSFNWAFLGFMALVRISLHE